MKKFNFLSSNNRCKEYRNKILDISQRVHAIHLGGAFSCLEILDIIYFYLMKKNNKKKIKKHFFIV